MQVRAWQDILDDAGRPLGSVRGALLSAELDDLMGEEVDRGFQ